MNMRATGIPDNLSGRLTPGNVISDGAGNLTNAITGEPVARPDAPTTKQVDEKPSSGTPAGAADPLARLDADDVKSWREQLKNGVWTPAELQRVQALSDAELEAIANPPKPMSKARAEQELSEIAALRKSGSKEYWSEKVQVREQELLGMLEKQKAAPSAETEKPTELAEIETELKKIGDLRRSDLKAYWANETQQREQELLQARADMQNFNAGEAAVRTIVDAVLGALEDGPAFQASFDQMFADLSEEAQNSMREALRTPAEDPVKLLPEAKLTDYASLGEETARQVKGWGANGLKIYTRANARLNAMVESMPAADAEKAAVYLNKLTPREKAAIVSALAG